MQHYRAYVYDTKTKQVQNVSELISAFSLAKAHEFIKPHLTLSDGQDFYVRRVNAAGAIIAPGNPLQPATEGPVLSPWPPFKRPENEPPVKLKPHHFKAIKAQDVAARATLEAEQPTEPRRVKPRLQDVWAIELSTLQLARLNRYMQALGELGVDVAKIEAAISKAKKVSQ